MPTLTTTERDRINERIREAVKKTKRKSAAPNGDSPIRNGAPVFPPERGDRKGEGVSLQEASFLMEETMRSAMTAAGAKNEAEFRALPKTEQNAFLAQATGQAKTGVDPNEERQLLQPRQCFRSPWNRTHFDEEKMRELVESVRKHGVIQDGLVRPKKRETATLFEQTRMDALAKEGLEAFELIAGERRWHAAEIAQKMFPAKVRRNCSDEDAIELQAIENLQREDPNPIETGAKYQQLLDVYGQRGLTREDAIARIAERCQVSRSSIYDALRLLKLPDDAKNACFEGRLPPTHARELSKLEKNRDVLLEGVKAVLHARKDHVEERENGILSMRETKSLVKNLEKKIEWLHQWNQEREKFESKGWVVLTPEESHKMTDCNSDDWWRIADAAQGKYVRAETYLPGASMKQYQRVWKKPPQPILVQLKNGRPVHIYERTAADQAVKEGGKKTSSSSRQSSRSPSEVARDKAHKARVATFRLGLVQLARKEADDAEKPGFWKLFVRGLLEGAHSDAVRNVCAVRGFKGADHGALKKLANEMDEHELRAFALQFVVAGKCAPSTWSSEKELNAFMLDVLKHERIDYGKLKAEATGGVQSIGRAKK